MSYTYLMTDGNNYKIGYTDRTPQQRVKELMSNSSTYYEITIDAYTEVLKGKQLEKRLHNHFNNKRIHAGREWFSLDIEDVAYIHNIFELEKLGECFAPFSKEGKRLAEIDEKQKEHKKKREEYNKNKKEQEKALQERITKSIKYLAWKNIRLRAFGHVVAWSSSILILLYLIGVTPQDYTEDGILSLISITVILSFTSLHAGLETRKEAIRTTVMAHAKIKSMH